MNLTDFIPGISFFKLAVAAALLAAVIGGYSWFVHVERDVGRAEVRAEWTAHTAKQVAEALAQAAMNAKETQRRLERDADAERKKDEALHAADLRVAALLDQLRSRPERPATGGAVSSDTSAGTACTGAGLYRSDGQFLAREAAAAARIATERDACHDRYDALTAPR